MSDQQETPDGSTNVTADQQEYTEQLGDGTPSGSATEDPNQDSDTVSGGEPDDEGQQS